MSKNILITGSSNGIGLQTAKKLNESYNVFITGRNEEKLNQLFEKYCFAGFLAVDLNIEHSENILYEAAKETLGTIDVLINNAGCYTYGAADTISYNEIQKMIRLNSEIPYLLSMLCIKDMKKNKNGRIINIGSISGVVGEAYASLYSMTKSSLIGFSKALALETAQDNITVNTINPGWVDTDLINDETLYNDFSKDEIIETIPQRRFVHPDEIADLCAYLISDSAKGITGQSINLCAGLSIG